MKRNYEIYQITSDKSREFGFIGLDFILAHYGKVEKSNYAKVYSGELVCSEDDYDTLERLYRIFNIKHPVDFKGHSLSVADVVVLDNKIAYYCDSFGWEK